MKQIMKQIIQKIFKVWSDYKGKKIADEIAADMADLSTSKTASNYFGLTPLQ